ncbi:prickle-like protein 1-B isoform X2 [Terrapene carolina triunguis]|uniref:prickle-like protein 1-B isoform X2 n=1 Tax=Terrapene triunguis TaxID=2587831 RepID=UPI000CEFB2C6|nr:prickle-like protein 1-B isoform X2 [Terrapene carolina triunguis]XP_026510991.1 prickle-like protein 1-B isoform X2 [Terrapene carolina triunguis]
MHRRRSSEVQSSPLLALQHQRRHIARPGQPVGGAIWSTKCRDCSRFLLMSRPSPTWPRRDKPPCSGTLTGLAPTSSSDSDSGCALEEYLERAADAAPAEVSSCFEAPSADRVPAATRSQLRIKSLLQQLPPQDCNDRYCPGLGEEERRQLQAFSARRRQESLGQGFACLVPSAHLCEKDGKLYCGRHHAEFFRPRCAACDQLIFTDECTEAEGRRWHTEHFCCLECDLPLGGQRYVMKGGRPCCCSCFESLYAELCQACGELIGVDSEQATHQGRHWHARASCFCCSLCQKPLLGQPVTSHHSLLYCSEACSLEKAAASSTASDSSDSAFVSAPSPDSTPVSRASSEGGRNAPPAPTMGGDSCQQRAEAEEMEDSPDQASTRPAFRSQDGHGTAVKERSKGIPCPNALAQAAAAPPGQERSSTTLPSELGLNGPGALGDQLPGRLRPQPGGGALHFRIGSSTDPSMAARQSPGPSLTDARPPDVMEEEDSWCPTCSSSSDSDSEQEGFFFGKPIPKAGPALPGRERSGLGRAAGRSKHLARLRGSRKHCSIS